MITRKYNCIVCGQRFPFKRGQLGYTTCLEHGEEQKEFTLAPAYNKGPYQVISKKYVKDIGK